MNQELIAQVVAQSLKAVEEREGQKIAAGNPTGPYTHGPGGLFSMVSGQYPILNAMIMPDGLLSALPSRVVSPHYVADQIDTLTGVTAGTGDEPEGVCDQPIRAGNKKLCQLYSPFGRQSVAARELDILRLPKRRDKFEDMAFTADFPINFGQDNPMWPSMDASGTAISRNEVANRILEMGVEFQRLVCPQVYAGTPVNNTGNGLNSGHMEPLGLEYWINVGNKLDMRSGAVCSALDSDVKDFDYGKIEGTDPDIVGHIIWMWKYLQNNAQKMRLGPVSYIISMPPEMWHELTFVWPCRYDTYRCQNSAGNNPIVLNDELNVRQRLEMLNGKYLMIEGVRVPVITDDCAPSVNWLQDANVAEGEFAGTIWFIPVTIMGRRPATEIQIMDQNESVRLAGVLARNARVWTTDGGAFIWTATDGGNGLCHDMQFTCEWRINMYTPQLAGRIDNVAYSPLQNFRDYDPEGMYFKDGGVTSQDVEKFYNQWNGEYEPIPA